VTVTAVALVAATVNVEEPPAAIDVGFAAIVTVGAVGFCVELPGPTEPHPAASRSREQEITAAIGDRIDRRGRETRTFIIVLSFLCSGERRWLKFKARNI
jgi:hypothetical protein